MKMGPSMSWGALGRLIQDQLQQGGQPGQVGKQAPVPPAGAPQVDAKKAEKAKGPPPPTDQFVGADSPVADRVRSIGLDNIKSAQDAIALLAPQYANAVASLKSAKRQAVSPEGTLRSAKLSAQMHQEVASFVKEGLNVAAASGDLGKLMTSAADGGRVTTQGKVRGADLDNVDRLEQRFESGTAGQTAHKSNAEALGHQATAAAAAETLLESFGISPRTNETSATNRLRGELDGLEMFDKKVAELSAGGAPPPEMQAMINQARSSLGQRVLGAQAGLLVEQRKSGLIDAAIDQLKDGQAMTPELQQLLVAGARDITDLQATSERAKSVSTNNVVAVFNLRIADIKPSLGDAKVHAQRSGLDDAQPKAPPSGAAKTAEKKPGANDDASGTTGPTESTASHADRSGLMNTLFGDSGVLTQLTAAVGSIFGPEAQARGESTLKHVEAFASEVTTSFNAPGAGASLQERATSALDSAKQQLEDFLEQQRQTDASQNAGAQSKATR